MCPLCNSKNYKIIGTPKIDEKSKKIINDNYKVVQCNDCQFYYVAPEINFTLSDWQYLYNEEYFNGYSIWYERKREKARNKRIEKFEQLLGKQKGKLLDLGCGEGFMLLEAFNKGWNAFGLDITDNRLDNAKIQNITFYKSDLLNADLPGNYFDCVYCDSVLEHILNPFEYLSEINRILKPGGIIYIGVPNEDYLLNDIREFVNILSGRKHISAKLKPFVAPYHVGGFNKNSLKYAITQTSFKIEIFRNFATRSIFFSVKFLSKEFFKTLLISLIYLLSVPVRREYYLEVYARKK